MAAIPVHHIIGPSGHDVPPEEIDVDDEGRILFTNPLEYFAERQWREDELDDNHTFFHPDLLT